MKLKLGLVLGLLIISTSVFASTHILFLGDSLSEGIGLDEEQSFPRLVERNLKAKKHDVIVTNGGVSGSTSASGLTRLKWHLKKPTDILVLELGANDGLRGLKLEETKKNLVAIIKMAKEKKVKVLLLGLLMPPNYGKKYTDEFEAMYKKIASTEKVPFHPFILKDVAGKAELNMPDGVHPNAKGQELVAKTVTEFVEKNL
ncbi:arylesterase [Bacteriovorax sp. PP10]|uniref:Arylesterase n=1 Tax=Bacteriovorax antarcticus TaxID=3088717 RepID=A0ABU5VPZ6_9BACT|nr:arylesterase [Bacteriovorax sp. PP10]MEA9355121.1 arylesterase [Bacteriovorax sp. PP10]